MTDDTEQTNAPSEDGPLGKPSAAEGGEGLGEEHEVLDVSGKPSQAEGGDEA